VRAFATSFALASLAMTAAAPALAEKPLIAVVPFTGPQAKTAEATVVRTLRRKASLVPPTTWQKAAKKLFAKTHQPDDIASVAEDVHAVVVITGVVKRDGRAWQLAISVRDGKTGRSHDKLKYPLKGPRVTESTLKLLTDEIDSAFEHTLAAAAVPSEEPPPRDNPIKRQPPPPPKAPPVATAEPSDDEPPPKVNAKEDEAPPIQRSAPVASLDLKLPERRPRWAPWFDLDAGASISGRNFDFDPSSQPRFKSGVVGGIRLDATLYPFAFSWRKAAGVLATLGFGVTFSYPFWLPSTSKSDPNAQFPTHELQVEGGLRWRFVLYKKVPRPELTVLAGGGLHSFSIDKQMNMDVGPPDVSYKYLSVGAKVRLHFAEWASLWAQFNYHVVFSSGSVQTVDEFGPGSVYGLRAGGGIDFLVWRGLKIGGLGYYERYTIAFSGTGTPPPQKVASSAIDQYFGGVFVLGYVF
jgi:hypothetical protein